ncbi:MULTISPECIES: SDR family NAD(P)-dependent oxidoreductase [Sphingobium]|uniref:SDR family NAD(P)-dependent oxidoreductase n=1 Tax=Sphingobium sp. MI1205 TaxID=407020 RepID=UPI0007704181|nr:SDR family NAD(P)-dependent oxidoreductase [Sphingobium sp. MI1205]AMK19931.1 putative 3-oxoacyl-[acyl-carrier-protein] reductase [Sphingobium sp. MI1205]
MTERSSSRLAGRHILITGAASGIGLATATRFAAEGAKLALLDRDREGLERIACRFGAHFEVVDLLDEAQIAQAVARSVAVLGALDGVVNVAGIGGDMQRLEDIDSATWRRVVDVNLTAPFLVMREALPHLRKAKEATVVNISSGQGLMPSTPGMGSYCASKGGLVMFSKAMALELAPTIRVNVVCPGVVDTPLLPPSMSEAAKRPESPYALKRVGEASEIADAILFLTSGESSFVTGIAMSVDGGRVYH